MFMLDANGAVSGWNQRAERIKRWSTAEILGSSYDVFFTPEDRAAGVSSPTRCAGGVRKSWVGARERTAPFSARALIFLRSARQREVSAASQRSRAIWPKLSRPTILSDAWPSSARREFDTDVSNRSACPLDGVHQRLVGAKDQGGLSRQRALVEVLREQPHARGALRLAKETTTSASTPTTVTGERGSRAFMPGATSVSAFEELPRPVRLASAGGLR